MLLFEIIGILALVAGGISVVAFLSSGKGRFKIKAVRDIFVSVGDNDPRIMEKAYDVKIDQLQNAYKVLTRKYEQTLGEKAANEKKVRELTKALQDVNKDCMAAQKAGYNEDARAYATRAQSITRQLEVYKENVVKLEDTAAFNKERRDMALEVLNKQREAKELAIARLEASNAILSIEDTRDINKANSVVDKMLREFEDMVNKTENKAVGAEISYKTSQEYEDRQRQKRTDEINADSYIQDLMNSVMGNSKEDESNNQNKPKNGQ